MITDQMCDGACLVDECVPAGCGDGTVADGEACDDGNQVIGDGCSRCRWEPIGVKAMGHHTCAWFANGTLKCWGRNDAGQLGIGHTMDRGGSPDELWTTLPDVPLSGVTAVAGSLKSTCAISNGEIYCWGGNSVGELGRGDVTGELLPTKVPFGAGRTFVHIEASLEGTFCAKPTDGPLLCWGKNDWGQTGRGLGVTSNAAYENIGDEPGELQSVPSGPDIENVTSMSVDVSFACAISGGDLRCWGAQQGVRFDTVLDIYGDEDGEVSPPLVDLGQGFEASNIAIGGTSVACVLSTGGDVKCWGDGRLLPTQDAMDVGGVVKQITAGRFFTCALLETGDVRCWGRAQTSHHILPYDALDVRDVVVPLPLSAPALSISAGLNHVCALLNTATVRCIGDHGHGQLGTGERPNTLECTQYAGPAVGDPRHALAGTCCAITGGSATGAFRAIRGGVTCASNLSPTRE